MTAGRRVPVPLLVAALGWLTLPAVTGCEREKPRPQAGTSSAPAAASQPGKPQAAPVEPFLPLLDAGRGEWARYAAMDSRTIRYEVTQAGTTTVKTQVIVHDHGKPLGLPATREDPRDLDPVARQANAARADRRQTNAIIEAAGRKFNATLYEDHWIEEEIRYVRRTWVHPQVPVFGMIRMELYGDGALEARLELLAAGGDR